MINLKAECRDLSTTAKSLRRNEIIPASIYGKHLKESLLIQIPLADASRFLSASSRGDTLTIELSGEKYSVLFKQISYEPITNKVYHIEFQHMVAGEAVNSVARIVLINRDKNQNIIQQHIEEIPYNALPKYLVSEVIIDLDGMAAETSVKVGDLDIAKDENIKLAISDDIMVVSVASVKMIIAEEETSTPAEEPKA